MAHLKTTNVENGWKQEVVGGGTRRIDKQNRRYMDQLRRLFCVKFFKRHSESKIMIKYI